MRMPLQQTRRSVLTASVGLAVAASSPALSTPHVPAFHRRRVTSGELRSAAAQHVRWCEDPSIGRRADFSDCDLSGLEFPNAHDDDMPNDEGLDFLNLSAADFTNADLSYCKAGNISFRRCHLHDARLSFSEFRAPGFVGTTLRRAKCDHVQWGQSTADESEDRAALMYVDGVRADFSSATIRGYIYSTTFVSARMVRANLAFSTFAGTFCQCETNSFYSADLSFATFRGSKLQMASFRKATIDQVDFDLAEISVQTRAQLYNSHPHLRIS